MLGATLNPTLLQEIAENLREGLELHNLGQLEPAEVIYEKILKRNPEHFDALQLLGALAIQKRNWDKALRLLNDALKINITNATVYNNLGIVLKELKRLDEALTSYDKAIELKPDNAEAYSNRGNVLKDLKRLDEALTSYDKAIGLKRDYARAYSNRGLVLQELKRLNEALTSHDKAIELKNDFAEAYSNRSLVLQELKRMEEALVGYDKAIELKPDYADAYNHRGNALYELKRLDEALASYGKAIELKPDYADAYNNRGNTLNELKRLDEASANYGKAIELKPDYEYLLGTIFYTNMSVCDWENFEANAENLSLRIIENQKVSPCLPVLAWTDSLSTQRTTSEIWAKVKHPTNLSLGSIPKYLPRNRIRIGYYSADFHDHATAYLMAELFELHDKKQFELIAFSFGPDNNDEMRQRLILAFDKFIDVRHKSDKDIALMSREIGIDIAIDLKGYTKDQRLGIFSYRAAPIQANYIGYPGTLAAEYIDYIIADPTLIPIENRKHYSEKVIYLPHTYQVNDRRRVITDKAFTKEELNLPNDGFVFCCFNNNYKITPKTFDGWVRILRAVEGSVLWLLEDNPIAGKNLRKEAQSRGIDPNRLVFAKRMTVPEHLARHRMADLFIDTIPYNAHTTASDALWAGLPVLTCMGESFASRVAASLLNAIELPELIMTTQAQYEATAIELATSPAKLKAIKDKLECNRLTTALFDTPRYTKHLETAYTRMYERGQADLLPDHLYIDA